MTLAKKVLEAHKISESGGKPFFGQIGKWNYAIKIKGVDPEEIQDQGPKGLDALKKVRDFEKGASRTYIRSKGKMNMTEIKKWVKEYNPPEFCVRWPVGTNDDAVDMFYSKTNESENPLNSESGEEKEKVVVEDATLPMKLEIALEKLANKPTAKQADLLDYGLRNLISRFADKPALKSEIKSWAAFFLSVVQHGYEDIVDEPEEDEDEMDEAVSEEIDQDTQDKIKANNDKMTDLKKDGGSQAEVDALEKENDELNGGNKTSESMGLARKVLEAHSITESEWKEETLTSPGLMAPVSSTSHTKMIDGYKLHILTDDGVNKHSKKKDVPFQLSIRNPKEKIIYTARLGGENIKWPSHTTNGSAEFGKAKIDTFKEAEAFLMKKFSEIR